VLTERRSLLMEQMTPVLVVTPHPDDAEGGAGGTIARWTKQGRKVVLVVCTNGDKGTSDRNVKPEDLARLRAEEQRQAAEVLGIAEVVFLRFPDQGLEDCSEFREKLVRQIRLHRPETVVTIDPHHRYIRHRDHAICGRVTLDAIFPYARDPLSNTEQPCPKSNTKCMSFRDAANAIIRIARPPWHVSRPTLRPCHSLAMRRR